VTDADSSVVNVGVVFAKIGRFWGSIAADTDPSFDNSDVVYEEIRSGDSIAFEHVLNVAEVTFEIGRKIDAEPSGDHRGVDHG